MIIAENHKLLQSAAGRRKLVALLAITLLGAFFRLYRIGSLPPGDRYDPAFYGVDALRVLSGERPVFFYDYAGAHAVEPLFSYLVALCFLVVGPSTLGVHLTAALVGIATVPAVYLAAETFFASLPGDRSLLKRYGALMAALMIAVSYWHLTWSRYGVRAILVPFFAALLFVPLWRGLRRKRSGQKSGWLSRWPFVASGILLGASLYTYQAARVLPVLVLVGFAAIIASRGGITVQDWTNLILVGAVALLVFAPLGVYFLRHPDHFFSRIEEAVVIDESQGLGGNVESFFEQVKRTGLAIIVGVDETPYRTLPGRPSLNPFFSALFLMGIGFSAARLRQPVYVVVLAWFVVLAIPAMLAGQGAVAKRAIGTLPAVAMLIAIGALLPLDMIHQRLGDGTLGRWLGGAWGVIVIGGFVYSGAATYRDYFVKWASLPGLPTHFEVARASIGEYAGDLPPDEQIYISPEIPSHPVIRFHSGLRKGIQGYNGRVCLVVPERTKHNTSYIVVPSEDEHSLDLLTQYLPEGRIVDRGGWRTGDPSFVVYRVPGGSQAELPAMYEVSASWEGRMQLLGYDIGGDSFRPGETIELTLYYRALQETDQRYTAFVHLLGPENPASGGSLWAQNDSEPCHTFYPTSSWAQGEIIVDRVNLMVPDEAPVHSYRLVMGFYEAWSGVRLHAQGGSVMEHDIVLLRNVQVADPAES